MVKVRSFKGYLAHQDHADKIIAPAYDVLNTEEARAMADGNPMSFLHCNKPEIDLPPETDPYDMKVYEGGRDTLKAFVEKGWLVQDKEPTMYIY